MIKRTAALIECNNKSKAARH